MSDYSFGAFMREMFADMGITYRSVLKWTLTIMAILLAMDTAISFYTNGIPKTHNGNVIYVSHNYNKLYNFDWTDVEILTYSGDSHHVYFWGHQNFELRTNYHIHTIIQNRFFLLPLPTWHGRQLITELEIIDS